MSIDPNSIENDQVVPSVKPRPIKRLVGFGLAGIVLAMACMAVCAAVLAFNLMHQSPSKPATVVVAGIGYQVQTDLFGDTPAMGQKFKMSGVSFTVVGIMPDKGNSGFSSPNSQVFVPLNTFQQRLNKTSSASGQLTVNSVSVQGKNKDTLKDLQQKHIQPVYPIRDKDNTYRLRNLKN